MEPHKSSPSSLSFMLPFVRRYAWHVAGAALALLAAAALTLALGQGVRRLIDHGFASRSQVQLNRTALVMLGIVAALAVATVARFTLVTWLGERIGADIRHKVFDHVISLSPAWFETARTGDVLSRLTADTAIVQALAESSISQWVRSFLILVGSLSMLVVTSPFLSLFVLAVVPFVLGPLIVFSRRERRLARVAQERVADLASEAEEMLGALRTVQALNHEPHARAAFSASTAKAVAAALARVRSRAVVILVVILLGFGSITLALWLGGREVLAGRMSEGTLSAFVFYAILVATSAAGLSELWGGLQRAAGAADRIAELLHETPSIASPANPQPLPVPAQGRVDFDNVSFKYPARPDHPALSNFCLNIEAGQTVALVGPSGAGKTTIFQLMLRFYDPSSGGIRIDGVDLRACDLAALRTRVGIVPQDPVIFSTDVWTNIRIGRPEATDAQVRAAASAAFCDFIATLPDGFDSYLGEKGVRLSGGQRQRLAIARAILRDPPILLLDEATSALDSQSEQAVQSALDRLAKGRTTLIIAHRLATVRRADRIVVLDKGHVVAVGSHAALVAQGGLYARLAEMQFVD
jgi:ATP-binding cassette, subfamily B, bacterial